jgi:hypothetical protein
MNVMLLLGLKVSAYIRVDRASKNPFTFTLTHRSSPPLATFLYGLNFGEFGSGFVIHHLSQTYPDRAYPANELRLFTGKKVARNAFER